MSFTGKPNETSSITVNNDGFWPDLKLAGLLEDYRIPASEYNDNVILTGLRLAMINVNSQLKPAKDAAQTAGYGSLEEYADAHSSPIGNEEELMTLYKHAVFSHAKAFLLQQFNSLNRKPNAENQAKESPDTEQYWLNQSQYAIYLITQVFIPDTDTPSSTSFYVAAL